jgi:pimeloyl-ACP methyl ester carboxylesterase
MPKIVLPNGQIVHYLDLSFADPWHEQDVVLMVHGVAESSAVWFGWLPHLARDLRVVCIDLPGFGASPPLARPALASTETYADTLIGLIDALDIEQVHLIGAKFGGSTVLHTAAKYPQRVQSVTTAGGPIRLVGTASGASLAAGAVDTRADGPGGWAERSMASRLGSGVTPEQFAWWVELMAGADPTTTADVLDSAARLDLVPQLAHITAPVLMLSTEGSELIEPGELDTWAAMIAAARIAILPGDEYHVAAVQPDACAILARDFINTHLSTRVES